MIKNKNVFLVTIIVIGSIILNTLVFILFLNIKFRDSVYFKVDPEEDNQLHGYFEINKEKYYQIYTTTQVDIGNGLHYHKIDIR